MYCSFVNRCTRTHSDLETEAVRAASSAMRKSKRKPRPSPVFSVTSTRKLLRSPKLEHVRPARSLPAVPPREVSSPPGRPGIVGHVWEAAANSKLDMLHSPLRLRYGGSDTRRADFLPLWFAGFWAFRVSTVPLAFAGCIFVGLWNPSCVHCSGAWPVQDRVGMYGHEITVGIYSRLRKLDIFPQESMRKFHSRRIWMHRFGLPSILNRT